MQSLLVEIKVDFFIVRLRAELVTKAFLTLLLDLLLSIYSILLYLLEDLAILELLD